MYHLSPSTYQWDARALPSEINLALLSHPPITQVRRLTADYFAVRRSAGNGSWQIGTFEEVTAFLMDLPIPQPYTPRRSSSAKSDPLDLSGLNITLDI